MGNQHGLFDKDQFKENHKGVEDLIPSTIEEFLNYIPDMMSDLNNAYSTGTQENLTRAAHSLKGAIASVCSESVREIAYTIEKLSRDNQRDKIPQHIDELENNLKLLIDELGQFKKEIQNNE